MVRRTRKFMDLDGNFYFQEEDVDPAVALSELIGSSSFAKTDHWRHYSDIREKIMRNNSKRTSDMVLDYASFWGALMEKEVNKTPDKKLTDEIARSTSKTIDKYIDPDSGEVAIFGEVLSVLIRTWDRGDELAALWNCDKNEVAYIRAVNSDHAHDIFGGYKRVAKRYKIPEKKMKLRAKLLAEVLEKPEALDHLQKKFKTVNKSNIRSLQRQLPILDLTAEEYQGYATLLGKVRDILQTKNSVEQKKAQLRQKIAKEKGNAKNNRQTNSPADIEKMALDNKGKEY